MLKGRRGHGIALLDGDMWAVGGFDGYKMDSNYHRSCERFDHTTNTLAPTPSDLHKLAALVMCRTPSELCAKASWDGTLQLQSHSTDIVDLVSARQYRLHRYRAPIRVRGMRSCIRALAVKTA